MSRFTKAMRDVIELDVGRVLVSGPPGSGKTRLLVERFARLIERGADPERVLLLVLNRRYADLGYPEPPQVLSAAEQYATVRELLVNERREDWPSFAHLLGVRGFAREVADFVLRAQDRLHD